MTMHLLEQPLNPGGRAMPPGKVCRTPSVKRTGPESPDSVNAGFARSGENYGVLWSQQYGGSCPRCGTFTKTAYSKTPWRDGRKIRYHRCPACDFRFKSIAQDIGREVQPEPEQLRYLRKYGK